MCALRNIPLEQRDHHKYEEEEDEEPKVKRALIMIVLAWYIDTMIADTDSDSDTHIVGS